uniref:Protein E6 n=1 Tax=Rhinolophus ferrumequinum papillomavirus 2 TaxID=3140014 RepID=A0AAU6S4U0_9PAPI
MAVRTVLVTFMEHQRSFDLKQIADSCGIPLHEYLISCFYCNKWLTTHEKLLYQHAELLVVWKDDLPFACCYHCILVGARVDFLTGFSRSVPVSRFGEVCSHHWDTVTVRCIRCLRKLNPHEKGDIVSNNQTIFVIKGGFRALCCLCKVGV